MKFFKISRYPGFMTCKGSSLAERGFLVRRELLYLFEIEMGGFLWIGIENFWKKIKGSLFFDPLPTLFTSSAYFFAILDD